MKKTYTIYCLDNYESLTNDVWDELGSFDSMEEAEDWILEEGLQEEIIRIKCEGGKIK